MNLSLHAPTVNTQSESQVGIGFYGVWAPPETESETTQLPDDLNRPNLPETGSLYSGTLMLLGLLLIALAFRLLRKKRTIFLSLIFIFSLLNFTESVYGAEMQVNSRGTAQFQGGGVYLQYTTNINFGLMPMTNEDAIFFALANSNTESVLRDELNYHFVRIWDLQGSGWVLQARQNSPLTATTETEHQTLYGAELRFTYNQAITQLNDDRIQTNELVFDSIGSIHHAKQVDSRAGAGFTYLAFGRLEEIDGQLRNLGVQLFIPGTTPRDAVAYTTTITWILSNVVTNDF